MEVGNHLSIIRVGERRTVCELYNLKFIFKLIFEAQAVIGESFLRKGVLEEGVPEWPLLVFDLVAALPPLASPGR